MAQKHMKRCLTLLASKETQIKTTIHYLTSTGTVLSKTDNGKCWEGLEEQYPSHTLLVRMENGTATLENSMEVPQKFTAILFKIAKKWKQPKCPPTDNGYLSVVYPLRWNINK